MGGALDSAAFTRDGRGSIGDGDRAVDRPISLPAPTPESMP
jgi:hypothetical protein